jgi:RTX calcium-binding nonapeptide repeat (4 copies)
MLRQRNDARLAMPIAARALHIPQHYPMEASGSRGFTRESKSTTRWPAAADRADDITGGRGKDTIDALGGNYVVDGGRNADRLTGRADNDVLTGGEGGDTFVFKAAFGNDFITGFEAARRRSTL